MDEEKIGKLMENLAEQFILMMKSNNQLLEENLRLMKENDELRRKDDTHKNM